MYTIQKQMFQKAFLTTAVTEFTQISALLVDSIITTKCLGAEEIAAVGLATPFFFIVGLISCCLSVGLQIKCSYEISHGNLKQVNVLYNECLQSGTIISLIVSAAFLFLIPKMAFVFGAHGNAAALQKPCSAYLYGLLFELGPYVFLSIINSIGSISPNGNKVIIISTVIGGMSDIVLDLLAVFFRLGTFGIGLATSASVILSVITAMLLFRRSSEIMKITRTPIHFEDMREMIQMGLPRVVHSFANILTPMIFNAVAAAIGGTSALAVISCKSSLSDFIEIPAVGISGAVTILAAIAYGEENRKDLQTIMDTAHRYLILISLGLMLLLVLLCGPVASFYFSSSPEIIPLMRFMVVCLAISLPFQYMICTRIGYLESVNQSNPAHFLEILSNMLAPIIFLLLCGYFFGVKGIFLSYPLSRLFVCLWLVAALWIRKKHIPVKSMDYLEQISAFDKYPADYISYEITNTDECVLASEQVMLFCKGHHLNPDTARHAGLAVEELTTNIILHGSRKNHQPIVIDFRLVISEEHLIIRIRDNSDYFDVTAYKIQTNSGNPEKAPGIRIILACAENITYYRVWDTNTVIIKYQ